jgi:hypothetical protein
MVVMGVVFDFIPVREFLVNSLTVEIILISCTIFSLTLSIFPATHSVSYSFCMTGFCRAVMSIAGLLFVCKMAESRRERKYFTGHMGFTIR